MNKTAIQSRIDANLDRVDNLVHIYTEFLQGIGPGRREHKKTDVLRAAVVLTHATLEDIFRIISHSLFPVASKAVLDDIPLAGSENHKEKFKLGDLSRHVGKSVHEVIQESVDQYLERTNYNNVREITKTLTSFGIDPQQLQKYYPILEEMMNRRHNIVHRADESTTTGRGNHRIQTINSQTVFLWSKNVREFGTELLALL